MTGGQLTGDVLVKTVEVLVPSLNTSCSLPSLPENTAGHTQDGLSQCGGYGSEMFCHQFSQGRWRPQELGEGRIHHSSWRTGGSLYLMGDRESIDTTEVIDTDGNTRHTFDLKYETE